MGKVSNNMLQHMEKKTPKGVKCWVKDAHLHFEHRLGAIRNFHTYLCRQNLIKSTLHKVHTVDMCKVGLTAYDTKRWLCDNTIHMTLMHMVTGVHCCTLFIMLKSIKLYFITSRDFIDLSRSAIIEQNHAILSISIV